MRFSLIVSAYNQQDYIRECADSLLSQPADLEVVLVDDGSTDATPELCDEYAAKDPRVKVLHTKNGGTSAARNAGAEAAEGEYLIFIDGDDMLVKGCLANVDMALRQKNDPDFVICNIDRYIHETKEILPFDNVEGISECANIDEFAKYVADKGYDFSVSTCRYAIKSEFCRRNGLSFDNAVWHEDEHYTPLMMNAANSFAVCEGGFYLYRRHEGSKLFTKDIENIVEFIYVSAVLLKARKERAGSVQKGKMLYSRASFLFNRGINEGITCSGRVVPAIKKAVLTAIDADPTVADSVQKLKKYMRVFGKSMGTGLFLRMLRLKHKLAASIKK